jgi:hypothetical protein
VRRLSASRSGLLLWCALAAGGCGFGDNGATPDGGVDGTGPAPDAMPDMMPANPLCFGPMGWQLCLDALPSGVVTLTGTLDTDRNDVSPSNPCLKNQPTSWTNSLQPDACIVVGDKVTVTSLVATGKRPLVIIGGSAIAVTTLLDVGSRHQPPAGAGANSTECQPFKRDPGTGSGGGGGAGGSFGGQAGNGGQGNNGNRANGQAANADVGDPSRLRGGCPGQVGGNSKAGDGGSGGGAVYLVSNGTITIMGTIDASGAGGIGATANNGGSGGGSGGLIVLHAAAISTTATSLVFATGGGGSGGGAASGPPATARGQDGQDPVVGLPLAAAAGGTGGQLSNGNGGDGGNGSPATADSLDGRGGDASAGGGGGGGGGGFILSNPGLAPAVVSPASHALMPTLLVRF